MNDKFKKGDVVRVTVICGVGVPLPSTGVVEWKTNSPGWYAVRIKWFDYVNAPTGNMVISVERERICDTHEDFMKLA